MQSRYWIVGATLLESALPLARTIALARILPPDQFGIATTLVVTLAIVEMICDLGLQQSVMRGSRSVRSRDFLQSIHTLNLLRCIAAAAFMTALCYIELHFFQVEGSAITYWLVTIILLLRGFENFSLKRLARRYRFGREATLVAGMQIAWTLGAIVAAWVQGDFNSLLWGLLFGAALVTVLSHLLSVRRWRLGWHLPAIREACLFGLPLVPNGAASALAIADRIIVGGLLGARAVALYAVIMGVILVPKGIIYRLSATTLAALFANLQSDEVRLRSAYQLWIAGLSFMSLLYALAIAIFGAPLVQYVFGPDYEPTRILMCIAALNVYVKLMMLAPVPAAFALGHSKFILLGSLVAAAAVVPAVVIFAIMPGTLEQFLLVMTVFETLGLGWYLMRASQRYRLRRRVIALSVGYATACLMSLVLLGALSAKGANASWFWLSGSAGSLAVVVYAVFGLLPRSHQQALQIAIGGKAKKVD